MKQKQTVYHQLMIVAVPPLITGICVRSYQTYFTLSFAYYYYKAQCHTVIFLLETDKHTCKARH